MAAEIIDPLQPVEVDHEQGQRLAVALAAGDGGSQLLLEAVPVVELGHLVVERHLLDLLVQLRGMDVQLASRFVLGR